RSGATAMEANSRAPSPCVLTCPAPTMRPRSSATMKRGHLSPMGLMPTERMSSVICTWSAAVARRRKLGPGIAAVLPRHRHAGDDAPHDRIGIEPLDLRFGAQDEAVAVDGQQHGLDVVGRHVGTPMQRGIG